MTAHCHASLSPSLLLFALILRAVGATGLAFEELAPSATFNFSAFEDSIQSDYVLFTAGNGAAFYTLRPLLGSASCVSMLCGCLALAVSILLAHFPDQNIPALTVTSHVSSMVCSFHTETSTIHSENLLEQKYAMTEFTRLLYFEDDGCNCKATCSPSSIFKLSNP